MSLKTVLENLLENKDFEKILKLGKENRSVLKYLQVFLYDLNSVICWRAAEAIGLICSDLSHEKPEMIRDIIRRFFWSLTDESGGTPWSAAQVIAEIIRGNPQEYENFISNLAYFLTDENIRGYVMWGLGRIANKYPQLIEGYTDQIAQFVNHPDKRIRGFAAYALAQINSDEANKVLLALKEDNAVFCIYYDSNLQMKKIKDFAANA